MDWLEAICFALCVVLPIVCAVVVGGLLISYWLYDKKRAKEISALTVCDAVHLLSKSSASRDAKRHAKAVAELTWSMDSKNYVAQAAAWLHNAVEDGICSVEQLKKAKIHEDVISVVETLSRRKSERYTDYINRITWDRSAALVKRADLWINMARWQQEPATKKSQELLKRYQKALDILRSSVVLDVKVA